MNSLALPVIHEKQPKPEWLKIRPPHSHFLETKKIVSRSGVATVCQEAHCPNIAECWSGGTATFMIMGDTCTRGCKFCNVKTGMPQGLDVREPENLANAVKSMDIFEYIVITSVDRDDLPDQGAGHFAACITQLHKKIPTLKVEVLIPDFRGEEALLQKIIDAKPEVIAHNIETVKRLQKKVRDWRANYDQSLFVLEFVKKKGFLTKSSLMLGLGETDAEIIETMKDLRKIGVDFMTLGQYLKPGHRHLEVQEYVTPEKFKEWEKKGLALGFKYVASGPFVRSSYKAGEYFISHYLDKINNGKE